MKLYTEEQVRKQMEVLEDIIDLWDNGLPLDSHTLKKCKYALENLTPIELPSDEEMEKILDPCGDDFAHGYYAAINMIEDQIKQQEK